MRLIAQMQYRENYGDETVPHWKNKGGHEFEVAVLTPEQVCALGPDGLKRLVREALPHMEYANSVSSMHFVEWDIIEGHTEDERTQLEYDGKVAYPAVALADQIASNALCNEKGYVRHDPEYSGTLRFYSRADMVLGVAA